MLEQQPFNLEPSLFFLIDQLRQRSDRAVELFRACSITPFGQAFDHEVDHGDLDEGLVAFGGAFETLGETA